MTRGEDFASEVNSSGALLSVLCSAAWSRVKTEQTGGLIQGLRSAFSSGLPS